MLYSNVRRTPTKFEKKTSGKKWIKVQHYQQKWMRGVYLVFMNNLFNWKQQHMQAFVLIVGLAHIHTLNWNHPTKIVKIDAHY